MTKDDELYDEAGEQAVIRCVQLALRGRYGKIADENQGNAVAMKNRFAAEFEKWRLAFVGAKTADQFVGRFADFASRGGPGNKALQTDLHTIRPFLRPNRWQQTRALALLALAGYSSDSAQEKDKP